MQSSTPTPAKPNLDWYHWLFFPFALMIGLRRYITPLGWFTLAAIMAYMIITILNKAYGAIMTIVFHDDVWQFVQTASPWQLIGAPGHAMLLLLIHSGGTIGLVVICSVAVCLFLGLIYIVTHGTANPFRLFIKLY